MKFKNFFTFFISLAFGVAELCSLFRKNRGALSESSESAQPQDLSRARPKESANRAGNPKGQDRVNMVFGVLLPKQKGRAPRDAIRIKYS